MDKSTKWKIAAAAVIVFCIIFAAVAIYLIPRLYDLSVEADFTYDEEMTYVAMRTSSHIAGVIAVQTADNKPLNKEYLKLVISIARLFATSMEMQAQIDDVNKLIDDDNANVLEMQHLRAELTALIGDLCDYQQNFVEELAKAVDTKGQYTVSHSQNTANLAKLICKELG